MRRALAAALLATAVALPLRGQGRGEVAVGIGVGIGPRTGPVVSVAARGSGDTGVLCRAGGLPRAASLSCGRARWVGARRFAVAEVGIRLGRERAIRGLVPVRRPFVSVGAGIAGAGGDRVRPVYDVGVALYLARWTEDRISPEPRWTGYGELRVEGVPGGR